MNKRNDVTNIYVIKQIGRQLSLFPFRPTLFDKRAIRNSSKKNILREYFYPYIHW